MSDLHAEREYLTRRLVEVRGIRQDAERLDYELSDVLTGSPAYGQIPMMRFARWSEARRARLDEWLQARGDEIDHIEVELFVLAYAPPPPVWLVLEASPVLGPWDTLAALLAALSAALRRVARL